MYEARKQWFEHDVVELDKVAERKVPTFKEARNITTTNKLYLYPQLSTRIKYDNNLQLWNKLLSHYMLTYKTEWRRSALTLEGRMLTEMYWHST